MKKTFLITGLLIWFSTLCMGGVNILTTQSDGNPKNSSPNDFFQTRKSVSQTDTPIISYASVPIENTAAKQASSANETASQIEFGGILKEGRNTSISTVLLSEPPTTTQRDIISQPFESRAGVFIDDRYYTVQESSMFGMYFIYVHVPSMNWANTNSYPISEIHPVTLEYDKSTSTTYGCFSNAAKTEFTFAKMDVTSGVKTDISTLTQEFPAMASSTDGTIYSIGADGMLYTIDKVSGIPTPIGSTGVMPTGMNDMCFDNTGNTLYWLANNAVYTIDKTTGMATKTSEFISRTVEWSSIFTIAQEKAPAPSWLESMTAEFPEGALSGNIVMTMPLKSTSGADLTEELTYHLFVDEVETTGKASPGETIKIPLTLSQGLHDFRAYADNNGTKGMESSLSRVYIGHDTPKSPQEIKVVNDGNDAVISWSATTGGVNGGYIDTDAISYKLVRNPEEKIVTEATSSTTYTDTTIESMNYYTYQVTASDGVNSSEPTTSKPILLGTDFGVKPPFSHEFSNGFGLFTHNDANNDGYSWTYSDGFVWFMINPKQDSDDWLISPPITLESGKNYRLQLNLAGSTRMETEKVELFFGKSNSPSEMTTRIIDATEFKSGISIDEWIKPEESASYYIGLHIITPKIEGAINISDFSISQSYDSKSPSAATEAKATAKELGGMEATISFICPTTTFVGTTLTDITKVTVINTTTGNIIEESAEVTPGKQISLIDSKPEYGNNVYSIVCENQSGKGLPAEASCWVGLDKPGKPRNISWIQTGKSAKLTWETPITGQHGGYIDIAKLKYRVTFSETGQVIETTDKLEIDFIPTFETPQDVLAFNICAINDAGEGEAGKSNESAFGTPYIAPFYESFEETTVHSSPWQIKQLEGTNPIAVIASDHELTAPDGSLITAYDNDNGMAVYSPISKGGSRLEFPIVDISVLKKPVMQMWYYFLDSKTQVTISGNNNSGNEWTDLATITPSDKPGWNIVTIPLDKFRGESHLQLSINCTTPSDAKYAFFDNISIDEGTDTDLMISEIKYPSEVFAGKDFISTIKVVNAGLIESPEYKVQLSIEGKQVKSISLPPLKPCEMAITEIVTHLSSNATSATIKTTVDCSGDEKTDNNTVSADLHVVRSALPTPKSLENISKDGQIGIKLAWTAPESSYNAPITDSFENFEAGSVGGIDVKLDENGQVVVKQNTGTLGDYKLVDNDKLTTTTTVPMMGTPNSQNGMVCQVVDVEKFALRGSSSIWESHSGNKLLAFWSCKRYDPETKQEYYDVANDDWFILPKLAEHDKKISFWAKSLSSKYGFESFDIMASVESDGISDFSLFTSAKDVPPGYASAAEKGYTYYEFELPEEVKYAAIRYNSKGTLALLLDDLTYTPADKLTDIKLIGYNIYRNDEKLNDKPINTTEFTDIPTLNGDYIYNVTAVFAEGESAYSNSVFVTGYSGIEETSAIPECEIRTESKCIVITSPTALTAEVYTTDGRKINSVKVAGETRIEVPTGIYIVRCGSTSHLVIVK